MFVASHVGGVFCDVSETSWRFAKFLNADPQGHGGLSSEYYS